MPSIHQPRARSRNFARDDCRRPNNGNEICDQLLYCVASGVHIYVRMRSTGRISPGAEAIRPLEPAISVIRINYNESAALGHLMIAYELQRLDARPCGGAGLPTDKAPSTIYIARWADSSGMMLLGKLLIFFLAEGLTQAFAILTLVYSAFTLGTNIGCLRVMGLKFASLECNEIIFYDWLKLLNNGNFI